MKTTVRVILASAFMLASCGGAFAQTPPAQPTLPPEIIALGKYITTPEYIGRVTKLIQGGEKDVAPDCSNSQVQSWIGLQVIQPPVFSGDHPMAGAWRDQVLVNRCGKRLVYNVFAVAHPVEAPGLSLMAPGDTVLPPKVQQDVLAALDAKLRDLTCDTAMTLPSETVITKKLSAIKRSETGVIVGGQWVERWSVIRCGKYADANVDVTADGSGSATFKVSDMVVRGNAPAAKKAEKKPEKKRK